MFALVRIDVTAIVSIGNSESLVVLSAIVSIQALPSKPINDPIVYLMRFHPTVSRCKARDLATLSSTKMLRLTFKKRIDVTRFRIVS